MPDDRSREHVRAATRHMTAWLQEQGVYPVFGPEIEYFLFKNGQKVDRGGYDIQRYQQRVGELARQQGIKIAKQTYEAGALGQFEAALAIAEPETAGKWALDFKKILKQVAREQGLDVQMKPKINPNTAGNGFHVHMGVYKEDITGIASGPSNDHDMVHVTPPRETNLLLDQYGQRNGFAGAITDGLKELLEETQIFDFPSYNSLKRNFGATGSSYASRYLEASTSKGQYAIRIIDAGGATRLESRQAGMDADPDLIMAARTAGIVRGVERARNITYVSPFVTEQSFDRQHPPTITRDYQEQQIAAAAPPRPARLANVPRERTANGTATSSPSTPSAAAQQPIEVAQPARAGLFGRLFNRQQSPEQSATLVSPEQPAAQTPTQQAEPFILPEEPITLTPRMPSWNPVSRNAPVPTSVPLGGGLQVYRGREDGAAKDYLSYCFLSADQLPRLLGAATYNELSGGLMTNSGYFVSPVNREEYNLPAELSTTTSWSTINQVLRAQKPFVAPKFVRVLGDERAKSLVFSFRNEEERNQFVKREVGPYLLEALSLQNTPFHGALAGDGTYTTGKKPDLRAGEQPCLIFDAGKTAGYLEITAKSHKATMLRTELDRFKSRRESYEAWRPIDYDEPTPLQRRRANLIIGQALEAARNNPFYNELLPNARSAGLELSSLDHMLCERIDGFNQQIQGNSRLPIRGLNVSFESEFLVPPNDLSMWSTRRSQSLPATTFLQAVNAQTYSALGSQIVTDEGMAQKLEANTVARPDGSYPNQREAIQEYFNFRAAAQQDVAGNFPDRRYQRYSEHVHFSFKDAQGQQVHNLDPRFIKLLEASLETHWQVARPVVAASKALTDANAPRFEHSHINQIGNRQGALEGDFNNFIVRRDEPGDHHYEIRRTLPGPDSPQRKLPFNPMLMTQALLSSSVNIALAAYENPQLEAQLLAEAEKVRQNPNAYNLNMGELLQEMNNNPIFNHPAGMGSDLAHAIAGDTNLHINRSRRPRAATPVAGTARIGGTTMQLPSQFSAAATSEPVYIATDETLVSEVVRHQNWIRDGNGNYRIERSALNLQHIGRMENHPGLVLSPNYLFVMSGGDLHQHLTSAIRQRHTEESAAMNRAAEQGRIDPSTLNQFYQELAAITDWQRDAQGRYYRNLSEFTPEQVDTMRRVNGDVIIASTFAFIEPNTPLDRVISESGSTRLQALAGNIDAILPRATNELPWQRDQQTHAWSMRLADMPDDIRQTLLAEGNNVVPQEDGRIFVTEGSRLDTMINERGIVQAAGNRLLEEAIRNPKWQKDGNNNYRIARSELTEPEQGRLENVGAVISPNYLTVRSSAAAYSQITDAINHRLAGQYASEQQAITTRTQEIATAVEQLTPELAAFSGWRRNKQNQYFSARSDFNSSQLETMQRATDTFIVSDNNVFVKIGTALDRNINAAQRALIDAKPFSQNTTIAEGQRVSRAAGYRTVREYIAAQLQWDSDNDVKHGELNTEQRKTLNALLAEDGSLVGPVSSQYRRAQGALATAVERHRGADTELASQQQINQAETRRQETMRQGTEIARAAGYGTVLEYVAAQLKWDSDNDVKHAELNSDQKKTLNALDAQNASLLGASSGQYRRAQGALATAVEHHRNAGVELTQQQSVNQVEARRQETIKLGTEVARAAGYATVLEYVAAKLKWDSDNDVKHGDLNTEQKQALNALEAQDASLLGPSSGQYRRAQGALVTAVERHRNAGTELTGQQRANQAEAQRQETIRKGTEVARAAGYATVLEYVAAKLKWDSDNDVKHGELNTEQKQALNALEAQDASLLGPASGQYRRAQGALATAVEQNRNASAELTEQQRINQAETQRQATIRQGQQIASAAGYGTVLEYVVARLRWDSDNDVKPGDLSTEQRQVLNALEAQDASVLGPASGQYRRAQGILATAIEQHRNAGQNPQPPIHPNRRATPEFLASIPNLTAALASNSYLFNSATPEAIAEARELRMQGLPRRRNTPRRNTADGPAVPPVVSPALTDGSNGTNAALTNNAPSTPGTTLAALPDASQSSGGVEGNHYGTGGAAASIAQAQTTGGTTRPSEPATAVTSTASSKPPASALTSAPDTTANTPTQQNSPPGTGTVLALSDAPKINGDGTGNPPPPTQGEPLPPPKQANSTNAGHQGMAGGAYSDIFSQSSLADIYKGLETGKIDYFKILGIAEGEATDANIHKAYRTLASKHHPDKYQNENVAEQAAAEARFKIIKEAYDNTNTAEARATYKSAGSGGRAAYGAATAARAAEAARFRTIMGGMGINTAFGLVSLAQLGSAYGQGDVEGMARAGGHLTLNAAGLGDGAAQLRNVSSGLVSKAIIPLAATNELAHGVTESYKLAATGLTDEARERLIDSSMTSISMLGGAGVAMATGAGLLGGTGIGLVAMAAGWATAKGINYAGNSLDNYLHGENDARFSTPDYKTNQHLVTLLQGRLQDKGKTAIEIKNEVFDANGKMRFDPVALDRMELTIKAELNRSDLVKYNNSSIAWDFMRGDSDALSKEKNAITDFNKAKSAQRELQGIVAVISMESMASLVDGAGTVEQKLKDLKPRHFDRDGDGKLTAEDQRIISARFKEKLGEERGRLLADNFFKTLDEQQGVRFDGTTVDRTERMQAALSPVQRGKSMKVDGLAGKMPDDISKAPVKFILGKYAEGSKTYDVMVEGKASMQGDGQIYIMPLGLVIKDEQGHERRITQKRSDLGGEIGSFGFPVQYTRAAVTHYAAKGESYTTHDGVIENAGIGIDQWNGPRAEKIRNKMFDVVTGSPESKAKLDMAAAQRQALEQSTAARPDIAIAGLNPTVQTPPMIFSQEQTRPAAR